MTDDAKDDQSATGRPSMKAALLDEINIWRAASGLPPLDKVGLNERVRVHNAAERGVENLKAVATDRKQGGV
jgi:hypothetical protein